MGRHKSSEHESIGPRLWVRFVKRHFNCDDLGPLNAQLPLPIAEGEHFRFGVEPVPLPPRIRRKIFERAYELGRNPDGNYVPELGDEAVRFNLFSRVSQRVPTSAPWLLKDLRLYMTDEVPSIDESFSLLQSSLTNLDAMLVDVGPIAGWEKIDPDGALKAEQASLTGLIEAALPQSLALLLSLAHVFTWLHPPQHHESESMLIRAANDAVEEFADSLRIRGFDDADSIGRAIRTILHSGVTGIRYCGARTMPAGGISGD